MTVDVTVPELPVGKLHGSRDGGGANDYVAMLKRYMSVFEKAYLVATIEPSGSKGATILTMIRSSLQQAAALVDPDRLAAADRRFSQRYLMAALR